MAGAYALARRLARTWARPLAYAMRPWLPKLRVVGSSPIARSRMVARKPALLAGFRALEPPVCCPPESAEIPLQAGVDSRGTVARSPITGAEGCRDCSS